MEKCVRFVFYHRDLQIGVYKYDIESEYDFSNLVLLLSIITFYTNLITIIFNWSATGRNESSENVTGLKFESRTRSRSHTRTPI